MSHYLFTYYVILCLNNCCFRPSIFENIENILSLRNVYLKSKIFNTLQSHNYEFKAKVQCVELTIFIHRWPSRRRAIMYSTQTVLTSLDELQIKLINILWNIKISTQYAPKQISFFRKVQLRVTVPRKTYHWRERVSRARSSDVFSASLIILLLLLSVVFCTTYRRELVFSLFSNCHKNRDFDPVTRK